ncbi:MAG: GNAT family N-acetyltransferase [Blastococcus sp.]|nr:GNAT family N-acetyltransferase [Blastococcus sp.]
MTDDGGVQVALVRLGPAALRALADGDLATAEASASVPLSPYLAGPECRWVWSVRAEQAVADPRSAGWITGVVWDPRHRLAVGRAGVHGPPDEVGMVEVGYSIDPLHRRRGYARAAVRALLEEAAAAPEVTVVRASVGPGNEASLALVRSLGFVAVGEQIDEQDGLEIVHERPPVLR